MDTALLDIRRYGLDNDLLGLVESVANAQWDDANKMEPYELADLREYLVHDDNVLLVAHKDGVLAGMLLACKIYTPYKQQQWMYVDELDVVVDVRNQGIGRALMLELFVVAKAMGACEVWLGTEPDNVPATSLYESFHPYLSETFTGYTFRL